VSQIPPPIIPIPVSTGFSTSEGKIAASILAFLSLASAVVIYLIASKTIPAGTWADLIPGLSAFASAWITTNFASNRTAVKTAALVASNVVKPQ
jgi:hypothetical protein